MLHVAMPELVQVPDLALGLGGGAFVVVWKKLAYCPTVLQVLNICKRSQPGDTEMRGLSAT